MAENPCSKLILLFPPKLMLVAPLTVCSKAQRYESKQSLLNLEQVLLLNLLGLLVSGNSQELLLYKTESIKHGWYQLDVNENTSWNVQTV